VSGDPPWCLKALPLADVDLARQRGLQRLQRHLAAGGLAFIAPPRVTRDGGPWVIDAGWLWQCEPWLPGEADRSERVSPERLRGACQALACWHERARQFLPDPVEATWFRSHPAEPSPAARERAAQLRETLALDLRELAVRAMKTLSTDLHPAVEILVGEVRRRGPTVARELERWQARPVPIQPCLRDVWREHVLFVEERVSGLIDPQAARRDSPAVDLARLLGSLCGGDTEGWQRGLVAYSEIRPLSVAESSLIPPLDLSGCLLAGLHWIGRLLCSPEIEDLQGTAARDRLWHFAGRLAGGNSGTEGSLVTV
jgi:Ser/Thr protein kinase RdoA (MazF antagonist)